MVALTPSRLQKEEVDDWEKAKDRVGERVVGHRLYILWLSGEDASEDSTPESSAVDAGEGGAGGRRSGVRVAADSGLRGR